jgi:hypothetical protein
MDVRLLFGLSALLSLVSSAVVAQLYLWPRLLTMERRNALLLLIAPHLFFRFIGLSFLIPGVTSQPLPAAFAAPAAYGDLIAGILAIIATVALWTRASGGVPLAWVFNVWGAADLLFAIYQGQRLEIPPGAWGATFYIPTAIVPPLLVTHFLIFRLLLRRTRITPV